MNLDELKESVRSDTIKNRDNSLKVFRGIPTKEVISLLIEIMKKYSSEEENTAEYMVILDAALHCPDREECHSKSGNLDP